MSGSIFQWMTAKGRACEATARHLSGFSERPIVLRISGTRLARHAASDAAPSYEHVFLERRSQPVGKFSIYTGVLIVCAGLVHFSIPWAFGFGALGFDSAWPMSVFFIVMGLYQLGLFPLGATIEGIPGRIKVRGLRGVREYVSDRDVAVVEREESWAPKVLLYGDAGRNDLVCLSPAAFEQFAALWMAKGTAAEHNADA